MKVSTCDLRRKHGVAAYRGFRRLGDEGKLRAVTLGYDPVDPDKAAALVLECIGLRARTVLQARREIESLRS